MTRTVTALVVIVALCGLIYTPADVLGGALAMAVIVGLILNLRIEEPDK